MAEVNGGFNVFLGNGDGTFGQGSMYSCDSGNPLSLVVADLNEDGKLDLAAPFDGLNNFCVVYGNGDGSFKAPASSYGTGIRPLAALSGDVNADGNIDLAFANFNPPGHAVPANLPSHEEGAIAQKISDKR